MRPSEAAERPGGPPCLPTLNPDAGDRQSRAAVVNRRRRDVARRRSGAAVVARPCIAARW